MALLLLFQRQKVFIICCALGPKLSCLPKRILLLEEGEDGKVEKPSLVLESKEEGIKLGFTINQQFRVKSLVQMISKSPSNMKQIYELRVFQLRVAFKIGNSSLPDFLLIL